MYPLIALVADSQYVNNHENAVNKVKELRAKNEKFANFIQLCEQNPKVKGLTLEAFLILPIQVRQFGFSMFFRPVYSGNVRCLVFFWTNQRIASLLILLHASQRIPRYKLLVSELMKHTEVTHPDYENLGASLKLTMTAAKHINE